MSPRAAIAFGAIAAIAFLVWRAELYSVSRPGETPQPLRPLGDAARQPVALDAVLPVVPVGMRALQAGRGVLLVHFWAPWERRGLAQAQALDSLQRLPGLEGLDAVVVCFDPFPSVARFVARHRLRLSVVLDHRQALRASLPCPSIPFTYVLDARGRMVVAQPGEVDWLSPESRRVLEAFLGRTEPGPAAMPPPS